MMERYLLARAKVRSWWRRRRGKPDTLAHFARDLGFETREYVIVADGDVDAQLRAITQDIARRAFNRTQQ